MLQNFRKSEEWATFRGGFQRKFWPQKTVQTWLFYSNTPFLGCKQCCDTNCLRVQRFEFRSKMPNKPRLDVTYIEKWITPYSTAPKGISYSINFVSVIKNYKSRSVWHGRRDRRTNWKRYSPLARRQRAAGSSYCMHTLNISYPQNYCDHSALWSA